jgi:ectoine hydroxylase
MTQASATLSTPDLYPSRKEAEPKLIERQDPVVWGGESDGPLTAAHLRRYEQRGFLLFERMFSADDLQPYVEELDRLRGDQAGKRRPEVITEPRSDEVRSVFAIHENNTVLAHLCRHPKLVAIARQLLGGDVYIHQSRVNYKAGFTGKEFYWHSDFETWHVEDGMPRMRAVSCSVGLTRNTPNNGPLMLIPGSHQSFLSCVGETPENHYQQSLKKQEYGVPDDASLTKMVDDAGIEAAVGPAGSVIFFECNVMHGSNSNITPLPRSNCFIVYNSVENRLVEPFAGLAPRPEFIANRHDFSPLPKS